MPFRLEIFVDRPQRSPNPSCPPNPGVEALTLTHAKYNRSRIQ